LPFDAPDTGFGQPRLDETGKVEMGSEGAGGSLRHQMVGAAATEKEKHLC